MKIRKDRDGVQAFNEFKRYLVEQAGSFVSYTETQKQVHVMFTNGGVLYFKPKKDDINYISTSSDNSQIDRNSQKSRPFGSWHTYKLVPYTKEMVQKIVTVYQGYGDWMYDYSQKFSCNGIKREERERLMNTDYGMVTRNLRFVLAGVMLSGIKPAIEAYQYFMGMMSHDILETGQLFRANDVAKYDNDTINTLMHTADIDLGTKVVKYLRGVNGYGLSKLVRNNGGYAILLAMKPREDREDRIVLNEKTAPFTKSKFALDVDLSQYVDKLNMDDDEQEPEQQRQKSKIQKPIVEKKVIKQTLIHEDDTDV